METYTQTELKENEHEVCYFRGRKREEKYYCIPSDIEIYKKLNKKQLDVFHKKTTETMDIVLSNNKDEMDKGIIVKKIITI